MADAVDFATRAHSAGKRVTADDDDKVTALLIQDLVNQSREMPPILFAEDRGTAG
jgi:hypothetical protein